MAIAILAHRPVFAIFEAGSLVKSTISPIACSVVCASGSMFRRETKHKLLRIALKQGEVVSRLRLRPGASKCGTHWADNFLVPKILCSVGPARSFEMPTVSAHYKIVAFCHVILSGSCFRGTRWSCLNQIWMTAIEGEDSPYIASTLLDRNCPFPNFKINGHACILHDKTTN